ncbi:MetQ/NlpA family ABC transporter substrate-binding protein [Culicoidibacter larvae]|uniref:Lipoprotein n=1 Tax=Culicoidibacter larvae TaxID=2579976 RepID=A0A5R8QC22_9FIRM|nr:MetQ/NlpA family ABC transporter substrate-binding protein [Culicoidibacter larvae]TLG73840.1 methionine ABC transporter substrate-binding protein [Culicoidibacter larvae]
MKKFLAIIITGVLAVSLAACGGTTNPETKKIVIGTSAGASSQILEFIKPQLEARGIELEIKTFNDYVLPNKALDGGDIDANLFQHIPFLNKAIAENGYDFSIASNVYVAPIGGYSKRITSLDQLPEGGLIITSSSVADHGRILTLLDKEGVITLKDGVDPVNATLADIVDNPKNLQFKMDVDPAMTAQTYQYDEADLVFINSGFATNAGLKPAEEAIILEGEDSAYINVVVTRTADAGKEEFKILDEVLHSAETQKYINENFPGTIIPVNN